MPTGGAVLCSTLLLCIAMLGDCTINLDANYNILPGNRSKIGLDNAADIVNRTFSALMRGDIDHNEALLERARELILETKSKPERAVYEMLVSLAQPESCPAPEEAKLWLTVHGLIRQEQVVGPDRAGQAELLEGYLEHFGGLKFGHCASKAEVDFRNLYQSEAYSRKVYDEIGNCLEVILGRSEGRTSDGQLDGAAKRFNLDKAIKSRRSRQRMKKYSATHLGGYGAYVERLLDYQCRRLSREFKISLEVINLAQAMSDFRIGDHELKRINEFYRIFCVSPTHGGTRTRIVRADKLKPYPLLERIGDKLLDTLEYLYE